MELAGEQRVHHALLERELVHVQHRIEHRVDLRIDREQRPRERLAVVGTRERG